MGSMGDSSQHSTTSQDTSTSTSPWAKSNPELDSLFSGLQGLFGNTGITSGENDALTKMTQAGQAGNPFAGDSSTALHDLLTGGGGRLQTNFDEYKKEMAPYLSTDYSTINSPAVQAALQGIQNDVTSNVNGTFAASGRSGSGMNAQTLGRGIAQGEAPVIMNQANQDTAARMGAANGVFGAGATTAGDIAAMENQGINDTGTVLNNSLWGPQTEMAAEMLRQRLPMENLGMLANIGIPLAQLGTNSTGHQSGMSDTTNRASLMDDLTKGSQMFSNLFGAGKGGTSAMGGFGSSMMGGLSGLMGLLAL